MSGAALFGKTKITIVQQTFIEAKTQFNHVPNVTGFFEKMVGDWFRQYSGISWRRSHKLIQNDKSEG